jgi:hypothetical protein
MINDFRIEKSRLPMSLTTIEGESLSGETFVQASARHPHDVESAPEIMNAADAFFPLRISSGETLLVQKDRVREVQLEQVPVEETWSIGVPHNVEITMRGGAVHTGMILIEPMTGRSRVLDYLNRCGDRFLILHTDDGCVLLNRRYIDYVRPVE